MIKLQTIAQEYSFKAGGNSQVAFVEATVTQEETSVG